MLPLAILSLTPYYILWKDHLTIESLENFVVNSRSWAGYGTIVVLLVILAGIIAHEFIHGVTWAKYAKRGFKSIEFGMLWKELTPYCHCTEKLPIRQYIIGTLMPGIVLGFIPAVIAYITGNFWTMAFGLFFTAAAASDFMIINILRKEKPDDLVQDHPTKIGCIIYRKQSTT